jgi:hypothetical protein
MSDKTISLSERQYEQLQDAVRSLATLQDILGRTDSEAYRQTAALLRPCLLRFGAVTRELERKFEQ